MDDTGLLLLLTNAATTVNATNAGTDNLRKLETNDTCNLDDTGTAVATNAATTVNATNAGTAANYI